MSIKCVSGELISLTFSVSKDPKESEKEKERIFLENLWFDILIRGNPKQPIEILIAAIKKLSESANWVVNDRLFDFLRSFNSFNIIINDYGRSLSVGLFKT